MTWKTLARRGRKILDVYMGVSINGGTSFIIQKSRFSLHHPAIKGYAHLWNPPHVETFALSTFFKKPLAAVQTLEIS